MSFLRIQRTNRQWGSELPVSIFVDGKKQGEIPPPAPGSPVDFRLPGPGRYEVFFEIDGRRSALYKTPYIDKDEYQSLEIELPENPGIRWIVDWFTGRNSFGSLTPRSPAVTKHR
jgi:hypothetical protein